MNVHLDTDFGGDPDDACALAMLLGWPGVEVTGVTTNLDEHGERAGGAAYLLALAGRTGIPVVAGASVTLSDRRAYGSTVGDPRYWPRDVDAVDSRPGAALDALAAAVVRGDTIVTIGALTNLALLEVARHGALEHARVVVMGGWVRPPADDLPPWGPERDFNIQCDPLAASIVFDAVGHLTLAALPPLATAQLRARDLRRLRACGPIGQLHADQALAYAADTDRASLATAHEGLADDLLNFHWDPVTCAVAVGWPGAEVEELRLLKEIDTDGVVRMGEHASGRPVRVVTRIDGPAFGDVWLSSIARLGGAEATA